MMSTRKPTVRFAVDFANKKIIATKTTLKKARRYGSDEYKELCELLEAHPKFKVVEKGIKKNENKRAYHGLNVQFNKLE